MLLRFEAVVSLFRVFSKEREKENDIIIKHLVAEAHHCNYLCKTLSKFVGFQCEWLFFVVLKMGSLNFAGSCLILVLMYPCWTSPWFAVCIIISARSIFIGNNSSQCSNDVWITIALSHFEYCFFFCSLCLCVCVCFVPATLCVELF